MFPSYAQFEIRRLVRNPRYLIFTLVVPPVLYLTNAKATGSHINGMTWAAFFMVSMACYGALGSALNSSGFRLANERTIGWVRQLRATPLSENAWLATKVVVSLAVALPSVLVVMALGGIADGVSGSPLEWAGLVVALLVGSLPFVFLGLTIGTLLDPDTAQAAGIASYLLVAFLGGLFYPVKSFPAWLRIIAEALPAEHVAGAARSLFTGAAPALADVAGVAAWGVGLGVVALWAHRRSEAAVAA
jgi:ABC-2 type transport system permease protein